MRAQPQVPSLCIDETSLSCGELYTVVTNRAGRGGRGTLVTMIRGTQPRSSRNISRRTCTATRPHPSIRRDIQ